MYIYIGVRKFFSRDKSSFFVRSVYFFPIILIASFFFFSYPNIVKFFFFKTHVLSFEGMFECFPFQKHVVRLKFKTSITNDSMNSFFALAERPRGFKVSSSICERRKNHGNSSSSSIVDEENRVTPIMTRG